MQALTQLHQLPSQQGPHPPHLGSPKGPHRLCVQPEAAIRAAAEQQQVVLGLQMLVCLVGGCIGGGWGWCGGRQGCPCKGSYVGPLRSEAPNL